MKKDKVGNNQQWVVEIYGGVLSKSWLDRDLCLSGRVNYVQNGELNHKLISIHDKFFRVPQLAIYLDREVNKVLELNAETLMVPVIGLEGKDELDAEILERTGIKGLTQEDIKSSIYSCMML